MSHIKYDISMDKKQRNRVICQLYQSGKYTTAQLARSYGLTSRTVQRIAKAAGVVRTIGESNRVAAKLKPKHRVRRKYGD
jgi:DNA-binding transcriptional regulator LsrR (DeoR family)